MDEDKVRSMYKKENIETIKRNLEVEKYNVIKSNNKKNTLEINT